MLSTYQDSCIRAVMSQKTMKRLLNILKKQERRAIPSQRQNWPVYIRPECLNYQRAYECAEMAASHGLNEGMFILGNLLFWGRGCKADMTKAYEMYQKAYEHGFYDGLIMKEKIEKIKGWS